MCVGDICTSTNLFASMKEYALNIQLNTLQKLTSIFKDSIMKEDELDYSSLLKHLLNQGLSIAVNKFVQSIVDKKSSFLTNFIIFTFNNNKLS